MYMFMNRDFSTCWKMLKQGKILVPAALGIAKLEQVYIIQFD